MSINSKAHAGCSKQQSPRRLLRYTWGSSCAGTVCPPLTSGEIVLRLTRFSVFADYVYMKC